MGSDQPSGPRTIAHVTPAGPAVLALPFLTSRDLQEEGSQAEVWARVAVDLAALALSSRTQAPARPKAKPGVYYRACVAQAQARHKAPSSSLVLRDPEVTSPATTSAAGPEGCRDLAA